MAQRRSTGPGTGPTKRMTGSSSARSTRPGTGGRPAAKTGTSRPATAARPRRTEPREPVRQSTAWMRAAILLSILVMLGVTIVPTLRSLLAQRAQISQLQADLASQEQQRADLQRQAQLWQDPEYIETQARARLQFVRVGDRAYTVLGAGQTQAQQQNAPSVPAASARADQPWYGTVWQSIELADKPVQTAEETKTEGTR